MEEWIGKKLMYEYISYKKKPNESQYGTSPPINAWCSSTHRYSRW